MTSTAPIYAIGSLDSDQKLPENTRFVQTISELVVNAPALIVVNLPEKEQDELLATLHRAKSFWQCRIHVLRPSSLSRELSDGSFDTANWQTQLETHLERCKRVVRSNEVDPLVGWLGLDSERRLLPRKELGHHSIYSYPLVDAMYPDIASQNQFVVSKTRQDILARDRLVDRIRLCGNCNSAHINYVDTCPACGSIEIEQKRSLHCFTCGNVDDENKFRRENKLECPNCFTQLRHIGVDYDRPLESLSCNACGHKFVESETSVHCFSCGSHHSVSELIVQEFYSLKIGPKGEHVLKHGMPELAPVLSLRGKVDSGYFVNLVDWLNRLATRHKEHHLVLALYLPNINDYATKHGVANAIGLFDQITERLNGLFRESDICCQYRTDLLLVLMPKAASDHLQVVREKIDSISTQVEDSAFSLDVFAWEIPDPILSADPTAWFEARTVKIDALD